MGEKFNFLLLHLTLFNWTLPAVVEEICQTVIIANKTGSAKTHCCLQCLHRQRCWANGFLQLSDHTVLTHPFHHWLIQNTCWCWCRPFWLYTHFKHNCGWHSNLFIWVQLEQGAGRDRRVVLERNKTKGRASLTGVGSRKVSCTWARFLHENVGHRNRKQLRRKSLCLILQRYQASFMWRN